MWKLDTPGLLNPDQLNKTTVLKFLEPVHAL